MKLRLLISVLAAGCATTSGGRAERAQPKGPTAGEFYPLSVGTTWQYTGALVGDEKLEIKVLKLENGVAEDSTGAQLSVDAYGVRDQKRYLLRNPIEVGTKWTNVVSPSSAEHYEILAVDQACDSPAGTFAGCVVVQSKNRIKDDDYLVLETTFAPHVGIVRLSTTLETKGRRIPQTALALSRFVVPSAAPADAGSR